jgi:hypothetical protein
MPMPSKAAEGVSLRGLVPFELLAKCELARRVCVNHSPGSDESMMVSRVCHPPDANKCSMAPPSPVTCAVAALHKIFCSSCRFSSTPKTVRRELTRLNKPCMQRNAIKCQSLNHFETSVFVLDGQVAVSFISRLSFLRILPSCCMTPSMDWSCNPGRFSVGKELERKRGFGSTGKPFVTWL